MGAIFCTAKSKPAASESARYRLSYSKCCGRGQVRATRPLVGFAPSPHLSLCTMSKRPGSESEALIKRTKLDAEDPALQQLVVATDGNSAQKGALIQTVRRTSGLQAPIMCLQVSSTTVDPPDYSSPSSPTGPPRRNPRRQVLARRRVDCFGWSGQDDPAVEGLRQLSQVSR